MLSNWFPIRGYDSDDDSRFSPPSPPRFLTPLPRGVSLSIRPRLELLELAAIGFFPSPGDLSPGLFFFAACWRTHGDDLVPRAGRLHAIDSLRPDYPGNGLSRIVRYSHERVHRPVDFEKHTAVSVQRRESRAILDGAIFI